MAIGIFGELYEGILKELQSAGVHAEGGHAVCDRHGGPRPDSYRDGEVLLDPACGTGGFLTCAVEALKAQAGSVEERRSIGENVRGWEWKPLPNVEVVKI